MLRGDVLKLSEFVRGEHPGAGEEAKALGGLKGEAAPPPWDGINDELGVTPEVELLSANVDGAAVDVSEVNILIPNLKLAIGVAHWCAAIAAPPRLVKHQGAMGGL